MSNASRPCAPCREGSRSPREEKCPSSKFFTTEMAASVSSSTRNPSRLEYYLVPRRFSSLYAARLLRFVSPRLQPSTRQGLAPIPPPALQPRCLVGREGARPRGPGGRGGTTPPRPGGDEDGAASLCAPRRSRPLTPIRRGIPRPWRRRASRGARDLESVLR